MLKPPLKCCVVRVPSVLQLVDALCSRSVLFAHHRSQGALFRVLRSVPL